MQLEVPACGLWIHIMGCAYNNFWTAFSAIFEAIGAIGTMLAVFVALYQTKLSNKKKLRLSFSMAIGTNGYSVRSATKIVCVTVTNIGNKRVIITRWGFVIGCDKSKRFQILNLGDLDAVMAGTPKLPCSIESEQTYSFYYSGSQFSNVVNYEFANNICKGSDPIRFFVTDTTGKDYWIKVQGNVGQLLDNLTK